MFAYILFLLLPLQSPADVLTGPEAEQNQIRSQVGCFDVTFQFKETETLIPGAVASPDHLSHGLEYVILDTDEPGRMIFQHILVTPFGPQKHWRQEWVYEGTDLLTYVGTRHWQTQKISAPQGQWVQRVYQVDDSPRYECTGKWDTTSQSWECLAPSPLPRREFTVRSDYDILMRGNIVQIKSDGWVHGQKNEKFSTVSGTVVAKEEGANTYVRTAASRCESAEQWWKDNGQTWKVIQDMWLHIRGHHTELKMKARVDGKLLWERLFEIAEEASAKATSATDEFKKQVHDTIHLYFE